MVESNFERDKNLINNQNFIINDPEKGETATPCTDVYKAKIQSDGSIKNLNLTILVRGDLQNEEMIGDTWDPTVSKRTIHYFLADAAKHKPRLHQLYFIESFLQSNFKHRFFVDLDSRY